MALPTQNRPLVRVRGTSSVVDDGVVLDTHMMLQSSHSLRLPHVNECDAVLQNLAYRILQQPADIRSHVRRILLLVRKRNTDQLLGAFADLFIVLQNKGGPLKNMLLEYAKPVFNRTTYFIFSRYIGAALPSNDALVAQLNYSLLKVRQDVGHTHLVRRHDVLTAHPSLTPLEEAQALIADGQLGLALDVLENELLRDAEQPLIMSELLGIYQYMRDYAKFVTMSERLQAHFSGIPDGWIWLDSVRNNTNQNNVDTGDAYVK
jgi:hypothetical protein